MKFFNSLTTVVSCSMLATNAVPYSEYILAPASRTLFPLSVYKINGAITGAASLAGANGSAIFNGVSSVTFDYGKNIAGVVSVTIGSTSSPDAFIGLTYSESSIWISELGSDATGDFGRDEILWLPVGKGAGTYTVEREHERGAFKYLSLISNSSAIIEVTSVSTYFTAAPNQDLRGYKGYFHSNDELLNRIWYAGAYTNQLGTIDPKHGNSLVHLQGVPGSQPPDTFTWFNNYTISKGTSCITDGAKRDRLVWPGDLSIALPSIFTSTNDLISVKNGIDSLLILQRSDGLLPYAGKPFSDLGITSFTYHLYSLIGIAYYYRYSGDLDYLRSTWEQFKRGLQWSLNSIDSTGLMDVTSSADWLRFGMGGHNIEANSILYHTLTLAIELGNVLQDNSSTKAWTTSAFILKTSANILLYDGDASLYRDNEASTLHPQDGNVWAIKSSLASPAQASIISNALRSRWGPYGAPAPEADATISPFISGFELEAHFLAGEEGRALELMRLQWGFMLDDERMTNSTFVEGYSVDGSLHYAPYPNDARISHAHGWSTAPTSLLSFYVAGIHLESASGKTWRIQPALGDLTNVEAGFESNLGKFWSNVKGQGGVTQKLRFGTPAGTTGKVVLKGVQGSLVNEKGNKVLLVNGEAKGLNGGIWTLQVKDVVI